MKILTGLLLIFLATAQTCSNTITQGIGGRVSWIEGNQMPGVYQKETRPEAQPVQRTLRIYPPLQMEELKRHNDYFFMAPDIEPIKTITSNEDGTYLIALEPGQYSLLIEEEDGLWANSFDGNGVVNPVQVWKDSVTQNNILINYKASY